jgi:hypothetical protein
MDACKSLLQLTVQSLDAPSNANLKLRTILSQAQNTPKAELIKKAIIECVKDTSNINPQTIVLLCKLLTMTSVNLDIEKKRETLTQVFLKLGLTLQKYPSIATLYIINFTINGFLEVRH